MCLLDCEHRIWQHFAAQQLQCSRSCTDELKRSEALMIGACPLKNTTAIELVVFVTC